VNVRSSIVGSHGPLQTRQMRSWCRCSDLSGFIKFPATSDIFLLQDAYGRISKSCDRWWHCLWPGVSRYKALFAFKQYLTELCYKLMVIQTVKTTILWRACQADRVLESANGAAMKSCAEPIQKKS